MLPWLGWFLKSRLEACEGDKWRGNRILVQNEGEKKNEGLKWDLLIFEMEWLIWGNL